MQRASSSSSLSGKPKFLPLKKRILFNTFAKIGQLARASVGF